MQEATYHSTPPTPALYIILIGIVFVAAVNGHDLVAHLVGVDFCVDLVRFDPQLGLVEFAVPSVVIVGSLVEFVGVSLLLIQMEKGYSYRLEKHALNLLIVGPVLWVIGSIHNLCQFYERSNSHVQILQKSVQIPFLMGSLLFLVGGFFNRHNVFSHMILVFKMHQMDGIRLEKLRGGALERLIREREGKVPLILNDDSRRRRRFLAEDDPPLPQTPVIASTSYKEVEAPQPQPQPSALATPYKDVLIRGSSQQSDVRSNRDQRGRRRGGSSRRSMMKYYNGCLFHKVEKDFMAQTGDPTGTGAGGDSVYKFLYGEQARFFKDEIHPDLKHSKMGTVAMASAGEDCNASQVFGLVEEKEGLDTLAKINESLVDDKGRPFKDIRRRNTAEERLEDTWVPMDEKLAPEELEELIRAKDAHTNIGDIPDAEIKPPENVLFVCKLNPVTQDEDLFTIFSRFGTVTSADIIRDYKTGDSLCYAFIEFETNEACERAFFKMDNVLIDDRRIHVDFSQSVSKLWNQYRHGKGSQDRKGGCFKCGNTDHIARDCQQGSNNKQQGPKYVLKNDQTQHGGDGRKRYDMVFDEDLEDKNIRYDDKNRADERADDRAHRDHRRSSESSHRPKDERDYRRSESDRYRREDYHERKRRDRDDDDA
ncbi:uncharacterized protein A4U43_C06F8760 [Asparagus officinalis]|uniref:Peptidyl-prolyl cis-trans isomerase n=2 Tax=Magnoliopsida TaxID=3398 RepID=A0A5P1EKI9_ASPOF|nr:uncharacterized protein A4U43_C06F8760 [Asparagus officinalis]